MPSRWLALRRRTRSGVRRATVHAAKSIAEYAPGSVSIWLQLLRATMNLTTSLDSCNAARQDAVVDLVVVVVVVVDLDGDGDVEVDATVDATTASCGRCPQHAQLPTSRRRSTSHRIP